MQRSYLLAFGVTLLALAVPLPANSAGAMEPMVYRPPPAVAASSYLLIDADTGKVLVEHNGRESVPPASLTKILTGLHRRDRNRSRSHQFERRGADQRQCLADARFANVRTRRHDRLPRYAVARHHHSVRQRCERCGGGACGGQRIGVRRHDEQQAELLGMTDSHFVNATGLAG